MRSSLKKYIPTKAFLQQNQYLKVFGSLLHDHKLWYFNRTGVANAFTIGLFMAFIPIPFQMVPAAALAILFRANLPISVALVWVTNPLTMPVLFYFAYAVGAYTLGMPLWQGQGGYDLAHLMERLLSMWQPFLLGCFLCGITFGILANFTVRTLWYWQMVRIFRQRRGRTRNPQKA